MIQALALAVLCALPVSKSKPEIRGDWIEINTVYRWERVQHGMKYQWELKQSLRQIILWKMDRDSENRLRPRVVHWSLYRDEPIGHSRKGVFSSIGKLTYLGKWYTVTESFRDHERESRKWFPVDQREQF